jgi:Peptidase family M28/PDZ domain/PA domain
VKWKRCVAGIACTALVGCAQGILSGAPRSPTPEMSATRIERDVAWLAADAREGRGLGTPGLAAAASYIASELRAAGFEPAAGGDYLQRFEMPVSIRVARASLQIEDVALERSRDFDAFVSSGDGSVDAELVFAGYGISAPEHGFDEYADIDAKGRIVLILDDRPGGQGPLAASPGIPFLRRAYKISNARKHGAAAVLLIPASRAADALAGGAGAGPSNPTLQSSELPVLGLSAAAAERIVAAAGGASLAERRADIDANGPASEALGMRARIDVAVARRRAEVANVVGVLRGGDPELRHEAVVIGAHFDHLGRGEYGSLAPDRRGQIHPGADDNASGVAGLLELARAFAAAPAPRRSLVMAAFTGEEAGLAGSSEYTEAPAVPLADTVAMLNLDMIGRLRDEAITIFGAETSPGFPALVARAARGVGLRVTHAEGAFAPSDQSSFETRGIPVLFFFTGIHTEYHTPEDVASLVNGAGERDVLRVVYQTARALLDADQRPRVRIVSAPAGGAKGAGAGYGPYLGTVPDFTANEAPGVTLQAVRAASPAEHAGLRAGDRIVAFDGAPVANLEEFAALLFEARAGQRVEIAVMRDSRRLVLEATLGERR